jgi:hypothetical protein
MEPQQHQATGTATATATAALAAAIVPTRSVLFYTLTATIPLIVITIVLLFFRLSRPTLRFLAILGCITGVIGLGRLLYELTLDVAGFPAYKLPIWSVFYLIIYLVSAFAFLFFALHIDAPDRYFAGFNTKNPKIAYLDALYLSLCDYIGTSPDGIRMNTQTSRYLTVTQGLLSMFINVVIITKFVNVF